MGAFWMVKRCLKNGHMCIILHLLPKFPCLEGALEITTSCLQTRKLRSGEGEDLFKVTWLLREKAGSESKTSGFQKVLF